MNLDKHFSPYQVRWLADQSRIKMWEKSRRIGATYVQAYEDVVDILTKKIKKVWFSSADETAAREYIEYCEHWTRIFDKAAKNIGYSVLEDDKDVKVLTIEYPGGRSIHGLSSNPRKFRSKEGKIVLDEFAHHDDPKKLWIAAKPCITWGYPLRILSTHNGAQTLFYKFIERIKKGQLHWGFHSTPIELAAHEGLVERILKKPVSEVEIQAWLQTEREDCGDDDTWFQEYCCQAIDEATAFLPYALIYRAETPDILKPLEEIQGEIYVGFDVARVKDLSVIWVLEKLGLHKYTRAIIAMKNVSFADQRKTLFAILKHPKFRRACIDQTGIGRQITEEAKEFRGGQVEGINFTAAVKEGLAFHLRNQFEDLMIHIPDDFAVREDLHSVKKVTTLAGNIRFDVESSEKTDSHADRFWALALADHAESDSKNSGPIRIITRGRRQTSSLLRGF